MEQKQNDIQTAFEHGKNSRIEVDVNGVKALVIPDNMKAVNLLELDEATRNAPRRLKQIFVAHSPKSFIDYFNRYATEGKSAIFIDRIENKFVGVIDFHENAETPHFAAHRCIYTAPKTEESIKWLKHNNEKMTQEDFALFIEDSQREILEPNPAEMLEIAASLKANNNVDFKSAMRLDNGQVQFTYTETINGQAGVNGHLAIPEKIKLVLTPFKGSTPYEVEARFRYRITQAGLQMWYTLISPHLVINDAINDIAAQVTEHSNVKDIYEGTI